MSRKRLVQRDDFTLVVIDIQERLAAAMERRANAGANSARLVRTAALLAAPIVVTRQNPRGLGETVPELARALDEAAASTGVAVVDKMAFCACGEPAFEAALAQTGRRQVVIVGMETHICVAQTALMLHDAGYDVHVVADACCSRRDEDHAVALDRMRAAGVTVTTSESVMYEAVARAGTDEFRRLLAMVKGD